MGTEVAKTSIPALSVPLERDVFLRTLIRELSGTLQDIGEFARDNDLWIVSDEVYDTQVWEGRHLSPRALPGLADRTLVIGSLSKSHAMTGSRLGWLAGPPDVIAGATKAEQVHANATAAGWALTDDDLAEVDRITGRV